MLSGRITQKRGQTLVISIMVMFILAAVAAIFIAIVARNLFRSGRYTNVDAVAQIAEAGIRYADEMLTASEEGADWRPIPDNKGVSNVPVYPDTPPVPADDWREQQARNPDFKWTRAWWPEELGYAGPSGGFTTFHTGQGRFLLRVSYNPNPKDPLSKYIKIESIGRFGVYDDNDPTTWKPDAQVNLRREITAYKPIGITDYLRFITNKDNRPMDFALGCPGIKTMFGRPASSPNGARGGPIRVNGNLLWYGKYSSDPSVEIFLRGVYARDEAGGATRIVPLDTVEVAGTIKVDSAPDGINSVRVRVNTSVDANPVASTEVFASDSPDFTTVGGFYRDGSDSTDKSNMPRNIKRIEPPLVDQPDPTNTTTRYRSLTLSSGERIQVNGRWINTGRLGWGRGVYINNSRDRQDESETLFGGYTLRADWLKPNNKMSTYWKGPYYVPPGVIIVLNPGDTDGDGQADMTITRTDFRSGDRSLVWQDAWGNPRPDWGQTITMPYPDPVKGRDLISDLPNTPKKHIDGNGVIYAEGNIRIRGMLPKGLQLTVVSNENIYIEGSLLKFRDPNSNNPAPDNTCGLALLARKNVVVNTTQFFSPLNSISADDVGSDARDGQPPYHLIITNKPESRFRCLFEFAPLESETASNGTQPVRELFLRHAGEYGSTYINAWLNPGAELPYNGMLMLGRHLGTSSLPDYIWGVGDPNFNNAGCIGSVFAGEVFPLTPAINANLNNSYGLQNILQIGLDQTTYTRNNYLLGGLAIQPFDVRIEAVVYAQEGSFFVIPGNWFNPNANDKIGSTVRPPGVHAKFPFFGQPLDIRIIIDGAVSENMPPPISDVEEWMAKWGVIPETYGSSGVPTAHPNEGLTFLYDDRVAWPLSDLNDIGSVIRRDRFGRALPIAPRLPVSGSLVYFGDVM